MAVHAQLQRVTREEGADETRLICFKLDMESPLVSIVMDGSSSDTLEESPLLDFLLDLLDLLDFPPLPFPPLPFPPLPLPPFPLDIGDGADPVGGETSLSS